MSWHFELEQSIYFCPYFVVIILCNFDHLAFWPIARSLIITCPSRRYADTFKAATRLPSVPSQCDRVVSSRVDYCNAVFAGAPKTITDRLQRMLNAAARVVSDTRKFDRGLSRIMHTELHWLDVSERINYKLGMLMYRCQHNKAPRYLMDHCTSVSDVAYCQRLRSASSIALHC